MITHGPPLGVLDKTSRGEMVGCEHLLRAARRCRPQLHCFGHIHEGWGAEKVVWNDEELDVKPQHYIQNAHTIHVDKEKARDQRAVTLDIGQGSEHAIEFGKETLMVNASIMTLRYDPWNSPWLVDLDLERANSTYPWGLSGF